MLDKIKSILLVLVIAVTPLQVLAKDISVKTGLWETRLVTTSNIMPEPVSNTSTSCIEDGVFNPQTMLDGVQQCALEKSQVTGNKLAFAMDCTIQGVQAKVAGTYLSATDSGEGDMTVDMQMGPLVMQMTLEWQSNYIGECTEG